MTFFETGKILAAFGIDKEAGFAFFPHERLI